MNLLDVNILVAAHREDAEHHPKILAWLNQALQGDEGCAVSELVLSGLLRIITHPRIFQPPTPFPQALELVEALHEHPNLISIAPGWKHWEIFTRLCRDGHARGNLVPDAYHAALAMETGCTFISLDRDFARFPGLDWKHPLEA